MHEQVVATAGIHMASFKTKNDGPEFVEDEDGNPVEVGGGANWAPLPAMMEKIRKAGAESE